MQLAMFVHCMLFTIFIINTSFAAPEGIGDFDIEKVREAVSPNDSIQPPVVNQPGEQEHLGKVLVKVIMYLGIVILLILSIEWLFRRKGLRAVRGGGGGTMDIVETLPIGQNRMILMVRVMDEIYLLSQTNGSIGVIEKICGQKALDIIASSNKGDGTIVQFRDAFNNFMGKIKKPL